MNITKIYLVENCYGDPNKIYIGKEKYKTDSRRNRKQDHKKTYGKDIIFTYIDEVESLNSKDWKPLECFWIEYFRQLGFDLQNKNNGGNGPEFLTQESKNKISKIHKGRKCSEETRLRMKIKKPNSGPRGSRNESFSKSISKPILQYNLEGNFIKEWKNSTEIKNVGKFNTTSIYSCCNGKQHKAYNYIWRYKNNNDLDITLTPRKIRNYDFPESIIKNRKKNKIRKKIILQYDLEGNFIKEWSSLTEAAESVGRTEPTYISMCCRNKVKQAYNYIWKFKNK